MTSDRERYERMHQVFQQAFGCTDPGERGAYLDEACAGDAELRAEVQKLLDAAACTPLPGFEEDEIVARRQEFESSLDAPVAIDTIPRTIGGYRIVRELGRGGMGTVFEAEQDSPKRTVALKILQSRILSPDLQRRFQYEVEILGKLQHPGIARIYEAGVFVSDGTRQPFFAMELVRGKTLLESCESRQLSTRDRLQLFTTICDAVHHAHQRGVIHRDLKPANILVDADGQPKILDFGVARATDSDIRTTTIRTSAGELMGTVPYMSPEQASGDPDAIDTRSDVYALGVLLYELLSRRLPYDVAQKPLQEALRTIQLDDPTPISRYERTHRGDIDTILSKSLRKERENRYQSAAELAEDVRRHLRDEPISARLPSAWYHISKFTRRHTAVVVGAAATVLALAIGLGGTLRYARLESQQRQQAETNATKARDQELLALAAADDARIAERNARSAENEARHKEREAREAVAQAERAAGFQSQQIESIDTGALGAQIRELIVASVSESERPDLLNALAPVSFADVARTALAEQVFEPSIRAIDTQYADDPVLQAKLLLSVGIAMRRLGMHPRTLGLRERALEIRKSALGDEHPETIEAALLASFQNTVVGDVKTGLRQLREAIQSARELLGENHPITMRGEALLGTTLRVQGNFAEAEKIARRLFEHRMTVDTADDIEAARTILVISELVDVLKAQSKFDEAIELTQRVLDLRRRFRFDARVTVRDLATLGTMLSQVNRLDEADVVFEEALQLSQREVGENDPRSAYVLNEYAGHLGNRDQAAEAVAVHRQVFEMYRDTLGEHHRRTINALHNLGAGCLYARLYEESETHLRRALALGMESLGETSPPTIAARLSLGSLLFETGRIRQSVPVLREALERYRESQMGVHLHSVEASGALGRALLAQGKADEAEPLFREAFEQSRGLWGDDNPRSLTYRNNLGYLLHMQGKLDEAVEYYKDALQRRRRVLGDDHVDTQTSVISLAVALRGLNRLEEATPYFHESLEVTHRKLGPGHPRSVTASINMAFLLMDRDKAQEACRILHDAYASACESLGADHPEALAALSGLAYSYYRSEAWEDAVSWYRKSIEQSAGRYGDTHLEVHQGREFLGAALRKLQRFTEAETVLIERHRVSLDTGGVEHKDTRAAAQSLVDLYTDWNEAEPGTGHDARAAEWRSHL